MSKSSFKDIVSSSKPVFIDFYADWCGPCKMMAPIVNQLKAMFGDGIRIIKIDIDKNKNLSQKLDVMGVPTVMIFKNGSLQWRAMGVQTVHAYRTQIEKLL